MTPGLRSQRQPSGQGLQSSSVVEPSASAYVPAGQPVWMPPSVAAERRRRQASTTLMTDQDPLEITYLGRNRRGLLYPMAANGARQELRRRLVISSGYQDSRAANDAPLSNTISARRSQKYAA